MEKERIRRSLEYTRIHCDHCRENGGAFVNIDRQLAMQSIEKAGLFGSKEQHSLVLKYVEICTKIEDGRIGCDKARG